MGEVKRIVCLSCGAVIQGASARRMFCDNCIREKKNEACRKQLADDRRKRKGMSPDRNHTFFDRHVREHVPVKAGWRGRPCGGGYFASCRIGVAI